MPAQTPHEMLTTELQAIMSAEEQVSGALQQRLQDIQDAKVRRLLEQRLKRGERLMQQLEEGLQEMDGGAAGGQRRNEAVEGLLRLFEREFREVKNPLMKDAVLIGNVQKIEHYCIAAWGTAKAFARLLGVQSVVQAMERAIEEGKRFDDELTELAEREVNPRMLEGEQGQAVGEQRSFAQSEADKEADLKAREYRDKDGNIHHHTRKWMEQHGGGQQ